MEGQFLMRGYKLLCSSSERGGARCMRRSRSRTGIRGNAFAPL